LKDSSGRGKRRNVKRNGGFMKNGLVLSAIFCIVATLSGCKHDAAPISLKKIPIDGMEGVLTRTGVTFDLTNSTDGNGSLRIDADRPGTVRLFEVRGLDIENARLIYRAHIKTENLAGQAYLEMWCAFPGMGEYFSRGLHTPLTGTVDWTTQEIPFFLQKGQKPELVKLNVVVEGRGTVWIDDIEFIKAPLN
jgi:hypothetical protein